MTLALWNWPSHFVWNAKKKIAVVSYFVKTSYLPKWFTFSRVFRRVPRDLVVSHLPDNKPDLTKFMTFFFSPTNYWLTSQSEGFSFTGQMLLSWHCVCHACMCASVPLSIWKFSIRTFPLNPFQNDKFYTLQNLQNLQMTILNLMKMAESSQRGRIHCGKRRNCLLRAISPFHTVCSKDLYCRHVKTRACLGKG